MNHPTSPSPHGEEGSIVLALLMTVVVLLVAVGVFSEALTQLKTSTAVGSRIDAVQVALAGQQAAIADIRATPLDVNGNLVAASLPCSPTSAALTLTGYTTASAAKSYRATIHYYQQDNTTGAYTSLDCTALGLPPAAIGKHLARAVVVSCAPSNLCPSDDGTAAATGAGWRRTVGTYTFKTNNINTVGGLITDPNLTQCMVASYVNGQDPSGGLRLDVTNSCGPSSSMAAREQFEYTRQWNLQVLLGGQAYCVQDPEDATSPTTGPILFGACAGTAVAQWGINDFTQIQGVLTGGTDPNGWCITSPFGGVGPPGPTVTSPASVASCGAANGWQIGADVGAGGAAPSGNTLFGPTDQLVNYQEFGRCLDVTNFVLTSTYLIDFTCKQFPDVATYPAWNQRWCFQPSTPGGDTGLLYTENGSTTCGPPGGNSWCAKSPLATATQSVGSYVTLSNSCDKHTTAMLWKAWSNTGGSLNDYTWTDADGYCLEANGANQQQPGSGSLYSTIQVDTCNGSYQQKWNAPASIGPSQLTNVHEGTGGGAVTGP